MEIDNVATHVRRLVMTGAATAVAALLLILLVSRDSGEDEAKHRSGLTGDEESAAGARLGGLPLDALESSLGPSGKREEAARALGLEILVRDLLSEDPVPGLAFGAASDDSARNPDLPTTNAQGVVQVRPESLHHLRRASPPWQVAWSTADEVRSTGELWVYRLVELDIEVCASSRAQRPLDFAAVTVELAPGGPPGVPVDAAPQSPWNLGWMRQHRVAKRTRPIRPNEQGRARVSVPRVRWLGVRGMAPGWVSSRVEVPFEAYAGVEPIPVLVIMGPAPQVAVRVCDKDGRPLRGACVRAHIVRTMALEDVDVQRMQVPGAAFALHAKPDGMATVTLSFEGETTEEGIFKFDAVAPGELLITTHARGHAPNRSRLVRVEQDTGVDIKLDGIACAPVAIVWDGIPLVGGDLLITDITDIDRQTLVVAELDDHARAPGEWLVSGRHYWLVVGYRGRRPSGVPTDVMLRGCVAWDGRDTADLSELAKSLSEFREGLR